MEEYLQCMKTLRTQINDVEDQAVKITAEEQMQITALQNLENEINSVKCQTSHLREEIASILEKKGHICSMILEKQGKIASLGADSSTLNQTSELLQQERNNLSAKLLQKSGYYAKTVKEVTAQLGEQQGWIKDCKQNLWVGDNGQAQLREMDSKSLKEEYQELLSDKAGEAGYLQSLQLQIAKLMVLRNIHSFIALLLA